MKKIIITLVALIGFFSVYAQVSLHSIEWHPGAPFLRSGLEMNGEVAYDPITEVVQFKNAGMIKAFTSHQVQGFYFTEEQYGILREFTTYEVKKGSRPVGHPFFEIVLKGPLMVVRKVAHLKSRQSSSLTVEDPSLLPNFDYQSNFMYYVYYKEQFVKMSHFRKAILPLMDEYKQELSQYMRTKKMNTNQNLAHQIRLINKYNFMKASTSISKL